MSQQHGPTRRNVLQGAISLAGLASTGILSKALGADAPAGSIAGNLSAPRPGTTNRVLPGTQIVLLGTRAGPGVDLKRAQSSTAIVVDGVPYLVDCGYGAVRNMVAADINGQKIEKIVFTHLHNDHTSDLPALLSLQWTGGRTKPIDLYGPYGTVDMVRAAVQFLKADVGIRTADEGRTAKPEDLYHGHDVEATTTPRQIFSDDRVKVSSAENTHYPEHSREKMPYRSIGVRFDTKTRSVVICGDTNYSKNLVGLARDADVFICEIMDESVRDRWQAQLKANPALANKASINRHISETHSTPEDVGRMAAEAKVKLVVLNHQLTSAGTTSPLAPLLEAIRKYYPGEVVLGQDLMMI